MKISPMSFQTYQSSKQRTKHNNNPSFGVTFMPEFIRGVDEMVYHSRSLCSENVVSLKIYELVRTLTQRTDSVTVGGKFYPEHTGINHNTGEVITRHAYFDLDNGTKLANSSEILKYLERLDKDTKRFPQKEQR